MVDESSHRQRRFENLSESSRSYEGDSSQDDAQSGFSEENEVSHSYQERPVVKRESRKQSLRELREDFECDPELYGIRRSHRSRKEPTRFETPKAYTEYESHHNQHQHSRYRNCISSESDSDNDSVRNHAIYKNSNGRASGRTRGIVVNYKSAFVDESESDDDQSRTEHRKRVHPSQQQANQLQSRLSAMEDNKQVDTSDADSYAPNENLSDDEDDTFVERLRHQTRYTEPDEEVDVIEEVLTHAIRRIGATGNPTTLYNCRLEHDPNESFNPSVEKGEVQYLIKWRSWSHLHSTWETEASLMSSDRGCVVDGFKKLYAYMAAVNERQDREKSAGQDELDAMVYEDERNELLLAEKMDVDRIVAHSRDRDQGSFDYLVKWRRLDYRYCTWESGRVINYLFKNAVDAYNKRMKSITLPNPNHEFLRIRPKFVRLTEQPAYIGAGNENLKLRDYQLKGINWITHAWTRGNSVILADEMGLGKTVQAVSFLSYIFHEHKLCGPFLLVVPLSTVCSWQHELELWAPQMNALTYTGDHISRQLIREHEWSASGGSRRQPLLKFNVCITTYEILLKDKSWLGQVSWAALVVDEAHRLKNDASQLYKSLFAFDTNTRLLITGTPLQNSLKELWALLHFLMPNHFDDWETFESNYSPQNRNSDGGGEGYEAIRSLHRLIEPFLLRRVKKDVEQSLPAKTEQILRVEMSKKQSTIYRLILARNYDGLMKVTHGHRASFINLVMELKKCCNHASLIAPASDSELNQMTRDQLLKQVLHGSGKLMLLDKLLLKLRPKGHRVLIFSQMVRMLDIIADYLQLRGWSFQRLDGSIRGELRKQSLDHFNAEGSTDFCFLLSTRAGGLGINLATADTVVIFDSDWNPQNDIQAQARAHRIGQTKQVSVYRLVVKDSVEEKIIESATRKMLLDHLVIQRMDSVKSGIRRADAKGQFLTEILRHGAEGLFKQNEEEAAEVEVDIDDILNRAETRDPDVTEDSYNPANSLLSTFNVVTLDQLEQDEEAKPVHIDQSGRSAVAKSWSEIIPSDLREQVKTEDKKQSFVELELGPRRRRQVKAYQAGLDNFDNSASSSDSGQTTDDRPVLRFSDKEIRALIRAVKRFARPLERIDAIAAEAELPDRTSNEVREVVESVLKGCQSAMENTTVDELGEVTAKTKGPVYYYGKVAVAAKPLLQSLSELEILHKCLPTTSKEERLNYELPFVPKLVNWSIPWDIKDDVRLLVGVYEHGYDNWEAIKLDADLGLGSKLLPLSGNERPQANHIRTRVDYLLKMLTKTANQPEGGSSRGHALKHKSKLKSDVKETKSHSKRSHADSKHTEPSRISSIKPKSAEFVESDDSSSDSGDGETSSVTFKSKTVSRTQKRQKPPSSDIEAVEVKKRKKKQPSGEKASEPLHFTANREPVSISKEEEEEFHQMRGPLFAKCKKKLYPVKKQLKQIGIYEDKDSVDSLLYHKAIVRIGDHINSLTEEMAHKHERHSWRGYFWEFVQNFSDKGPEELQQIYRVAVRHEKALERDKRHKHSDGKHLSDRSSAHGSRKSDQPVDSFQRFGGDQVSRSSRHERDYIFDKSSRHDGFYNKRQGDGHSSNSLETYPPKSGDSYYHDASRFRGGNDHNDNRLRHDRPRHRRSCDWSNNSDRNSDRFNNAFNRPAPNCVGNQTHHLPSSSISFNRPPTFVTPPPVVPPLQPPWSPGSLGHSYSSTSYFQAPAHHPSQQRQPSASIIPPPILPPSVSPVQGGAHFSRDPRLASSGRQ